VKQVTSVALPPPVPEKNWMLTAPAGVMLRRPFLAFQRPTGV
jgi:hypothetical protein